VTPLSAHEATNSAAAFETQLMSSTPAMPTATPRRRSARTFPLEIFSATSVPYFAASASWT
jgi:hypothetical protein